MSEADAEQTPEQELKLLRKENRRLKRELEAALTQMRRTDELYRTSERVLTKAYHDLEQAVLRSRDIQEELNRTSKMAAVGEMAARVVHEVLNPMTSLLGRLQGMIKRHELPPESHPLGLLEEILADWGDMHRQDGLEPYLRTPGESGQPLFSEDLEDCEVVLRTMREGEQLTLEDLRFLERTSLHMVKIINSMRTLSRSRTEAANVSINNVLVDAIELLRDGLRKTGIAVKERYAPSLPPVYVDPNEMIQIFTNILRNAQQAIGRGGTVEVETREVNGRVEIRISDNGPGIALSPEKVDLIFEGGFTTKTRDEGTGLGLAICRRFARNYHGDVLVEWTAPGEGTRFLVWLPTQTETRHEGVSSLEAGSEAGQSGVYGVGRTPGEVARTVGPEGNRETGEVGRTWGPEGDRAAGEVVRAAGLEADRAAGEVVRAAGLEADRAAEAVGRPGGPGWGALSPIGVGQAAPTTI